MRFFSFYVAHSNVQFVLHLWKLTNSHQSANTDQHASTLIKPQQAEISDQWWKGPEFDQLGLSWTISDLSLRFCKSWKVSFRGIVCSVGSKLRPGQKKNAALCLNLSMATTKYQLQKSSSWTTIRLRHWVPTYLSPKCQVCCKTYRHRWSPASNLHTFPPSRDTVSWIMCPSNKAIRLCRYASLCSPRSFLPHILPVGTTLFKSFFVDVFYEGYILFPLVFNSLLLTPASSKIFSPEHTDMCYLTVAS